MASFSKPKFLEVIHFSQPSAPKILLKSSPESSKIDARGLQNRPESTPGAPKSHPEALQIEVCGPSCPKVRISQIFNDFWEGLGRFLGGSWGPKSTRNRQKSTPKSVKFSVLFRTSIFIDFGRVFDSKMDSKIDVFGVRNRCQRILAETSKFDDSTALFHVF